MNAPHAALASREAASSILAPDLSRVMSSGMPFDAPARAAQALADLPAGVWRAGGLVQAEEAVLSTGEPALDAVLPGGGWPLGALTELLQPQPHAHLWRLLAPGLAQALARQAGPVVLVAPPRMPFAPGLAGLGLPAERWLWVDADTAPHAKSATSARLWATEQALRCAEVAAVLAWLPQAEVADLRRLQLSAQRHRQLLFVMRPLSAQAQSSPARLRLMLETGDVSSALRVQVLKRRGPPLAAPVLLPAQPPLLARLLLSRRRGIDRPLVDAGRVPSALVAPAATAVPPAPAAPLAPLHPSALQARRHGLDRAASRA